MGLKDVFGKMVNDGFMPEEKTIVDGWGTGGAEQDTDEEGPRKKAKIETDKATKEEETVDEKPKPEIDSHMASEFEEELKAANATIIRTDDLTPDAIKQIVEDNVGMDVDVKPGDTIVNADWGTTSTSWGEGQEGEEPSSGWGPIEPKDDDTGWGDWGKPEAGDDGWGDPWAPLVNSYLMAVLGPTTLPLTHTTGIVEKSTRRIKSIILPPPIAPQPAALSVQACEGEDSGAVEEELEKRFARVVLQPWTGDNSLDARGPVIRPTSKGAVYPGSQLETGLVVEGEIPPPEEKVHDPLTSEIVLLVELKMVDIMSVGMGLEATWIQLVKVEGKDGGAGGKKKKKSKGSKVPKGYWYMEELLMTLPSFYTQEKVVE